METTSGIVEAKGLIKRFDQRNVVDGISFHIRTGECFGILGPNGAGKTSTIRMIYGLSPLSGGSLRVFGRSIDLQARFIKGKTGVCPQENNLDPDLTVFQNLMVFACYFSIPATVARQRTEHLLCFMSLQHRRDARISELSGGMKRRLIIARALINDPQILILDEPSTGLDPQSRHQIWERLGELRNQGMTMLLTTHYMDEAARLCDRLIIMDQGKILVEGTPGDLIQNHVGKHVIEINEPDEELRKYIHETAPSCEDLGHLILIYGDDQEQFFHHMTSRHGGKQCLLRMATLEDVFLRLTGRGLRE
jgi:lipooligosaccharide transport system ATP-binding protein